MSSIQLKQMAEFYSETRRRFLNSDIGLATQRIGLLATSELSLASSVARLSI
jgi:hypothetical protein